LIYSINYMIYPYTSFTNPLFILQKSFFAWLPFLHDYNDHTNPIFINLNILKFHDLVFYHNAIIIVVVEMQREFNQPIVSNFQFWNYLIFF
jgi:hypothetical protein